MHVTYSDSVSDDCEFENSTRIKIIILLLTLLRLWLTLTMILQLN